MLQLYRGDSSENSLREFTDSMDKICWSYYITQNSSNTFKEYAANLIMHFAHAGRVMGIAPNEATLVGGTATFVLPKEAFRKRFMKAFESALDQFSNSRFIYSSWEDGTEEVGFCIEQEVANAIYSEYCDSESFILQDTSGSSMVLGNYDELIRKSKK